MSNTKIKNTRKLLEVGTKAIEIEDREKHHFIVSAKNKNDLIKQLKPSLVIKKGETALKPLIYTMPDGYVIKGLAKKTNKNKIIGIIKTEKPDGSAFMQSSKEKYQDYKLFQKAVEDIAKRWLTSYIKHYAINKNNICLGTK